MPMGEFINWPPSWSTVLLLPALFVGFTVHELAHAMVAYLLGDTSQVERNRLSFNPLRHVSWVGMVFFLLFWVGWAKPVWMDPTRFRIKNRALGMFLVSISGALANLLMGLAAFVGMGATVGIVWTVTGVSLVEIMQFLTAPLPGPDAQGLAIAFSFYMMMVNLALAVFNLLPFPLLDGFQAVISLSAALRVALGKEVPHEAISWSAVPKVTEDEVAVTPDERAPAQIHFEIGLDYQKAGEWDEAIARYRQATAHDEQFSLAYYNLGLAYWAKGRASLAASAFRAAQKSARDPSMRVQAELRLHELSRAEQHPEAELGPAPVPLESGEVAAVDAIATAPLDPGAVRRLWLGLGVGGAGLVLLAVGAWLYVTVVTLSEFGGMGLM